MRHGQKNIKYTRRSTVSLTSAQGEIGRSTERTGRFTHGKQPRCPLNRRLGGSQGQPGRVTKQENILLTPRFEPQTI